MQMTRARWMSARCKCGPHTPESKMNEGKVTQLCFSSVANATSNSTN